MLRGAMLLKSGDLFAIGQNLAGKVSRTAIAINGGLVVARVDIRLGLALGKEVARRAIIRRGIDARPGSVQVVGLHALVRRKKRDVAARLDTVAAGAHDAEAVRLDVGDVHDRLVGAILVVKGVLDLRLVAEHRDVADHDGAAVVEGDEVMHGFAVGHGAKAGRSPNRAGERGPRVALVLGVDGTAALLAVVRVIWAGPSWAA